MRWSKVGVMLFLWVLPWPVRRFFLQLLWGYKIYKTARIGYSIILPDHLEMGPGAQIGHLTVCKGVHKLYMAEQSYIGNLNWITGSPLKQKRFFVHKKERMPTLHMNEHSAITNRHYIDCTDRITVGAYTTVAGVRSQILTHSIDLMNSRQDCQPVSIGQRCFVGSGCIILPGAGLGDYSVLGAGAVLNKNYTGKSHVLIAGVPAKTVKSILELKYFSRDKGFVE